MYLAYAVENDERMSGVVRCEGELPVNTGDALRSDGAQQSFESVEWLSEETAGTGADAATRLRYRVTLSIEGERATRAGALTLQYEQAIRSYLVVCPREG